MSCWVVPAIAAELWGVSLAQVLSLVDEGAVPSQREHGFLFVDVSPQARPHQTTRKPDGPPPPTFVAVTRDADEIVASYFLQDPVDEPEAVEAERAPAPFEATDYEPEAPTYDWAPPYEWTPRWSDGDFPRAADIEPIAAPAPDGVLDSGELASSVTVEEDPELPPLCEEEDDKPIVHWRQRRQSVGRTRRPPPKAA